MFNIYDQYGNVRSDILTAEEAAIDALDDSQRAKLFEAIQTILSTEEGESRVYKAREKMRDAETAYDAALAVYQAARPRLTDKQAQAQSAASFREGYKPPTPDEERKAKADALAKDVKRLEQSHAKLLNVDVPDTVSIASVERELTSASALLADAELPEKTAALLQAAGEARDAARHELRAASLALRGLQEKSRAAALAWSTCQEVSPDQPARDYQNRSSADRAERVKNGLPPDQPKFAAKYPSPLDDLLARRGKVANRQPTYFGSREVMAGSGRPRIQYKG